MYGMPIEVTNTHRCLFTHRPSIHRSIAYDRGFPVDKFSRWETAATYYAFGLHWGNPQAQNAKGHILGHIKVRPAAAVTIHTIP